MYKGKRAGLVTSNASLEVRLNINDRFSRADFHGWLNRHLAVRKGMDVLDVGCGNGAQAIRFLKKVGPSGSVSALDLSEASIARLREAGKGAANLQATVADMGDTGRAIARTFREKRYDLAQSTYALYYAADRIAVLDAMRKSLKPGGRLAVCTPNDPHSLSVFCGRFAKLPPEVVACGKFGPDVLEPYFRANFVEVDIHLLRNEMRFPTAEDVLSLIRNAAYFDARKEPEIRAAVDAEIRENGSFAAVKNSYLIVGHAPKK